VRSRNLFPLEATPRLAIGSLKTFFLSGSSLIGTTSDGIAGGGGGKASSVPFVPEEDISYILHEIT